MKRTTFLILTALLSIFLVLSLAACTPENPGVVLDEPETTGIPTEIPQPGTSDCFYPNGLPDAIGQSIADTYTITYDEVMTWNCDGYSYDDIMIALETSAATDVPVDDLLARLEEKTWEEIWVEIGLTSDH
jgi:hypothetical protein